MKLQVDVEGTHIDLDISKVLSVPDLVINLLSVNEICKKVYCVTFTDKACEVVHASKRDVIAKAREKDGLYKLDLSAQNKSFVANPCAAIWSFGIDV